MQGVLIGFGAGLLVVFAGRYINKALDTLEPLLTQQATGIFRCFGRLVREHRQAIYVVASLIALVGGVANLVAIEDYRMLGSVAAGAVAGTSYTYSYRLGKFRDLVAGVLVLALSLAGGFYSLLRGALDHPVEYLILVFVLILSVTFIVSGVRAIMTPAN